MNYLEDLANRLDRRARAGIREALNLYGYRVIEYQPAPKMQVLDIKMKDGTSILSKEFRDTMNADLLQRFGFIEYKGPYKIGKDTYVMTREDMHNLETSILEGVRSHEEHVMLNGDRSYTRKRL